MFSKYTVFLLSTVACTMPSAIERVFGDTSYLCLTHILYLSTLCLPVFLIYIFYINGATFSLHQTSCLCTNSHLTNCSQA